MNNSGCHSNQMRNTRRIFSEREGRVHAGNTTYTADSHPNVTKPRQENNMNVNGYKNTEDTQKQTNIYRGLGGRLF